LIVTIRTWYAAAREFPRRSKHLRIGKTGALLAVLAGFAFGLGAEAPTSGAKKAFIVYSTDERSELAPCG
jgi:hypothetical protein